MSEWLLATGILILVIIFIKFLPRTTVLIAVSYIIILKDWFYVVSGTMPYPQNPTHPAGVVLITILLFGAIISAIIELSRLKKLPPLENCGNACKNTPSPPTVKNREYKNSE